MSVESIKPHVISQDMMEGIILLIPGYLVMTKEKKENKHVSFKNIIIEDIPLTQAKIDMLI